MTTDFQRRFTDQDNSFEQRRLAALHSYEILDTPQDAGFDDIVRLAAEICGTPIFMINLLDYNRAWFKAVIGTDIREVPRKISLCDYFIDKPGVSIVEDASTDERFSNHPLVTNDPNLRFYAGVPLNTADGLPIGMLCVLDKVPNHLNEQQQWQLKALARQVMMQLELRQALRDKRATQNNLSLIVESARDFAIISMDAAGLITTWNPGAEHIFGYMPEEMIGQPIDRIFTPEDRALNAPALELTTAKELGRAADERWHLHKSGTRFFASGIMQSMLDEQGRVIGFTKIGRDITAKKNAEDALIAARNYAEAANMAKRDFLANMSHEIRTPMNAVVGLAQILVKSEPLTQQQRDFLHTLQLSADALLSLINDLLDISKIEAQSVDLEQVPFSLTQMVQEVISMMAMKAGEKGLVFHLEGETIEHHSFIGDPTRLRQIVLNLCSNAIKFTSTGGIYITVSIAPTFDANVQMISIAVRDTGIGIAQDQLENIFNKFTQADTSINRKYGGTGLGLAITKTLAEIMGGNVHIDSTVGVGSCFTVNIPLPVATEVSPEVINATVVTLDVPAKNTNPYHILLAEDYAPNVMVAGTLLEAYGYTYDVATNGHEAVERAKAGRYPVILMDVQMPGMSGLEATRIIRAFEQKSAVGPAYIIGMTAHALVGDKEKCLDAGMDDYMSKPFNAEIFKKKLAGLNRTAAFVA